MRYKDCMDEQRLAIKEVLTRLEEVWIKYNVAPADYNPLRALVKAKIYRISNVWHMFLASVVDAKFAKKANEEGGKVETHLKTDSKDGEV